MDMKKISNRLFLAGLAVITVLQVACNRSNSESGPIRMNQVGFAPDQEKTATIDVDSLNAAPCTLYIVNCTSHDTVWQGTASETMVNPVSGKFRQIVDFSDLTTVGEYTLCVKKESSIFNLSPSLSGVDPQSTPRVLLPAGIDGYRRAVRRRLRAQGRSSR